jgi:5-formyltetrahydrofolate cyclo-ligase
VHGTGQDDQTAGSAGRSGLPSLAGVSRPDRLDMPRSARSNQANPASADPAAAESVESVESAESAGQAGASAGTQDERGSTVPIATSQTGALARAKASLRAEVIDRRRAMTPAGRAAAGRQLREALLEMPELQMAGTVAAYVSVGTEPDTRGLIFALWKRGSYVLLPVLQADGDLDWASYEGPDSLGAGPRGLLEPTEPRRGVTAITSADLVIVPAVAVDGAGRRLGRGGGSYDRALARVGPAIQTVALLYGGELVSNVPAGPHDQPVRTAAIAGQGISRLR